METRDALIIRPMSVDDLDAVLGIERSSFSSPWSLESFVYELVENARAFYLVAEMEGCVAGYSGMWVVFDEGHITNVAVGPVFRRRGIGRRLLLALAECGAEMGVARYTLEVRVSNRGAQRLYEELGFRAGGLRKQYYQDNQEDALIMWWDLTGGAPDSGVMDRKGSPSIK